MFETIQKGPHINSVYVLLKRFIAKRYQSKGSKRREQKGMSQWKKYLDETSVPKTYFSLSHYTVSEKINGKNTHSSAAKSRLLKKLALTYASLLDTYRYHNETLEKDYLNWNIYLETKKEQLSSLVETIDSHFEKEIADLLLQTLTNLFHMDWGIHAKIPLHRDLHWENIFEEEKKIRFIDFEHFCLGPIEYEFSNSLFWNDEYSIPFDKITAELEEVGVRVNKNLSYQLVCLYFLDQLQIATRQQNKDKIDILCHNMTIYIKNYHNELDVPEQQFVFL